MRNERRSKPGAVLALRQDKGHDLFHFANATKALCSQAMNEEFGAYCEPRVNQFSAPVWLPFILKFLK